MHHAGRGANPGTWGTVAALVVWILAAVPDPARAAEADMVAIPGGSYPIGSPQGRPSARPAHRVQLSPFLIDRFEVTNAEYARFLETLDVRPMRDADAGGASPEDVEGPDEVRLFEGPFEGRAHIALDDEHARIALRDGRFVPAPGFEAHPVVETTWLGARAYCRWRGARLPSEAEWEAAARGRRGRAYPWGEAPPAPARAVYGRTSGETDPVGSHPAGATPRGIHDLAGNLAEWTSSLYRPYPYDPDDGREDPDAPGERVTRGGDHVFDSGPDELTGYFRDGFSREPDRGHRHIGFRCARSR